MIKGSLYSSLQSVSVEASVKSKKLIKDEVSPVNEYFGLSETGVQTDLTRIDLEELFSSKRLRLEQPEYFDLRTEEPDNNVFIQQKRKGSNFSEEETRREIPRKKDVSLTTLTFAERRKKVPQRRY